MVGLGLYLLTLSSETRVEAGVAARSNTSPYFFEIGLMFENEINIYEPLTTLEYFISSLTKLVLYYMFHASFS